MSNEHKKDDKSDKPADVKQPSYQEILDSQPEGQRHPEGLPDHGKPPAPEPKSEKHGHKDDDDDDDDKKGKKHK